MKKWVLVLSLILSFNAYGDEITIIAQSDPNDATTNCGNNCTWKLYSDGKLEISGTGNMYNYGRYDTGVALWEGTHGYQSKAPWGAYSANIQTIDIQNGITSIGKACFYNTIVSEVNLPDSITTLEGFAFKYAANLTEISLPNNLTNIGEYALSQTMIENFVIPESVTFIGTHAFGSNALQNITIEGNITLEKNMLSNNSGTISTTLENIYCLSSNASCNALKTDADIGSKIKFYERSGSQFLYNGKFYNNPSDIATANHIQKRIYTIDEANAVAGDKNRVSIKYR